MAQDGSVSIGTRLDTGNLRQDVQYVQREIRSIGRSMNNSSSNMIRQSDMASRQMQRHYSRYSRYMTESQQQMANEMKDFYRQQSEGMRQFAGRQVEVEHGFMNMTRAASEFQGTNSEYLDQLREQGNVQRKLNDEMMAANKMIVMDIHRTTGAMLARSTVASKISAQYERMGNPLYNVNQGFLAIADSMQQVAMAGDPAVTAVRMLGPTANGKQLNDMIRQINTQLMGLPIIAMGAAVATTTLFGTLHDAAYGLSAEYAEAFDGMLASVMKALEPMVQAFVILAVPIFNVVAAVADLVVAFNEAHPVLAIFIQGILMLVPLLTLILSPLALGIGLINGFMVALNSVWMILGPVVTGLAAMSGTVLVVAAAIMGLVVGIGYLWNSSETFRNAVYAMGDAIKGFGQVLLDFSKYLFYVMVDGDYFNDWLSHLPEGFQSAALIIGQAVATIRDNLILLKDAIFAAFTGDFTQITEIFATLIPTIIGILVGGLPALLMLFARFIPDIAGVLQESVPIILEVFNQLLTNIVSFVTTQLPVIIQIGVDILTSLVQGILESLPAIMDAITQVINTLVEIAVTLLPIIIDVGVQLLTGIIEGIVSVLPTLVETGMELIYTLINAVLSVLPQLIETAVTLIITIVGTLVGNLPKILETGVKILMVLIDGVVSILPKLIETAVTLIVKIVETIIANLPKILQAGIKVLLVLIDGLIQTIPKLLAAVLKIITEIVRVVIQNLPKILKAGADIMLSLIKGILSLIGKLYTTFTSDVFGQVKKAAKEFISDATSLGKDIISGMIKGIKSKGADAARAIKDIASDALDAAKDFLGIHSPSRVFADEVGSWIPPGIAMGVEDNSAMLDQQMKSTVDSSVDAGSLGVRGQSMGSTTTNNYNNRTPISVTLEYNGDGNMEDATRMVDFIESELSKRMSSQMRMSGVKR